MKRLLTTLLITIAAAVPMSAQLASKVMSSSFAETARLRAPTPRSIDSFGRAVAISGNYVIAGVPGGDFNMWPGYENVGGAYGFIQGGTQWSNAGYFLGSDLFAGDEFGFSAAMSGNTAIIGAPFDDIGANGSQGSAFIYTRVGDTWWQQAQLVASDGGGGLGDWFGWDVAIDGDTAVAGAIFEYIGPVQRQGAAYVYTRSGSTWTQQAKLVANDGTADAQLGRGIGVSGDNIVVGAVYDDPNGSDRQGSAYIFTRNGSTWEQKAKLVAPDGIPGSQFGGAGAISGNTVVIGCESCPSTGVSGFGAAYVFVNDGAGWQLQTKLNNPAAANFHRFGSSVAIDGDNILVGTPSGNSPGVAYLFHRLAGTWSQRAFFSPSVASSNAFFGDSVALSGGNLIVGAPGDDIQASQDEGSAFVFKNPIFNTAIGGRVLNAGGRGVSNMVVAIRDEAGQFRYTLTNPFGYYRFNDVVTMYTYTVYVGAKRTYTPRSVTVTGELTGLDFTPGP